MFKVFLPIFALFFLAIGCSHVPDKGINNTWFATELTQSEFGDDESHNAGKNCMTCHVKGGDREAAKEGVWSIGGTVYQTGTTKVLPGSTLELFTGPNGTGNKVISLPVDDKGNAYTNKNISFGTGLFPVVTGPTGKKAAMMTSIGNGACNSCHNNGTPKITVEK